MNQFPHERVSMGNQTLGCLSFFIARTWPHSHTCSHLHCHTTMQALVDGDKISFVGFGTFKVTDRAARTGRNPKTGEPLEIAASRSPSFSAGKPFKDKMNASKK